jgi:hypothetical protein
MIIIIKFSKIRKEYNVSELDYVMHAVDNLLPVMEAACRWVPSQANSCTQARLHMFQPAFI